MTITSAMFDTPKLVYQSANINHIASQGKGSLLDGMGADAQANTVTSSYGIAGNQSDKLSSSHSANILAQSSAKGSAGQSAKFYAGLKYETLSYPNPDIPKRGEITPFKGFPVVTTRGGIEYCQSINDRRVEFSESIKKGSVSATLCVFDIKYRANQYGNSSLNLRYSKYQPFGSISKRSSSLRQAALTHELNDVSAEAILICSNKSSSNRIVLLVLFKRSYGFLSFSSCIGSNHHDSLYECGANQYKGKCYKKTMPRSGGTLTRHLITTDNEAIEVTMNKHITPVTGRDSLTPNQSFRWLFLALERGNPAAKPHRIEATAPNEHSARLLLVRDYILSFAGRLPVREVAA